jgi:hypothetical protein
MTSPSSQSFLSSLKGGLFWLVLVLSLAGYVQQSYRLWNSSNEIKALQKEVEIRFKSFNSALGRSETKIMKSQRAINSLLKTIPDDIKEDLSSFKSNIKSLNTFMLRHKSTKVSGKVRSSSKKAASKTVKANKKNTNKSKKPKNLFNNTSKSCNWEYSDWRLSAEYDGSCEEGVFAYTLNQKFEGILVQGEGKSGSASYVRVWEKDSKGNRMLPPLFVKEFTSIQKLELSKEFYWIAPHIDLGVSLQAKEDIRLLPTIGVSVSGYGETVNDLDWRFFRVGLEASEDNFGVSFCPAYYNIGRPIPLFSNLWVGPCYGYNGSNSLLLQLTGVL